MASKAGFFVCGLSCAACCLVCQNATIPGHLLPVDVASCTLFLLRLRACLVFGTFATESSGGYPSAADVGLDEREKELIRMKMERLDAAKTIVDREHALHSGTAGPPSTSGGGGGGGAGGR